MTCHKCGRAFAETRTTTKAPYHYTSSGLANLYLVGIVMRRCASCRTESPVIPRMGGLHRTIARVLLDKPERLTGDELRFLRKFVGLSATDFASQVRIDPATLSRFENGKQDLGESADKLARAVVMAEVEKEEQKALRHFLLSKQRLLAKNRRVTRLRFTNGRWRKDAA